MIKHIGKKWILYSKDGSKKLGEFNTEQEAIDRENQIKRIKAMNKKFQQFETSINNDGSINILKVPIFKLGTHKGIDFNIELVDEIINNHKKLKDDNDYLSSVIIGHNEEDQKDEKPAEGFIDNLIIEDDTVYSDIVKVNADTFESSIKTKKYPHRSVEYNPKTKVFNALALLGGTAPHHKLPIMEFEDSEDHIRLDFKETDENDGDLKAAIEQEEKMSKIRNIWWKMQEFIDKIMFDKEKSESDKKKEVKSILNEGVDLLGIEVDKFKEDEPMQLTEEQKQAIRDQDLVKFKEEHDGMTPDEVFAENKQLKDEKAKNAIKEHTDRIKKFIEKAKDPKGLALAPVIADKIDLFMQSLPQKAETIKFKDANDKEIELSQIDYFEKIVEDITEKAQKNELFVLYDELTENIEFESVTGNAEEQLHKKADKAAKQAVADGKFKSYHEAYEAKIIEFADKK